MGNSNNSHIAFESDGDEGITFVKGIRLSDKVIDRMRESPPKTSLCPGQKAASCPHAVPAAPQTRPTPVPTAERLAPILPQPPQFVSTLLPPPLIEPVPVIEPWSSPPLQHVPEEVKTQPPIPPVPTTPATPTPIEDKVMPTPSVTEAVAPPSSLPEPTASSSPSPLSEPIPPPAQTKLPVVPAEPVALPPSPSADLASSTAPPPVATLIPPSVEHVSESLPTADPEVLQKPSVEPTVVPVFVEPVPVHASPVELVNISPPTEAVAPVSTEPSADLASSTAPPPVATPIPPSVEHVAESLPTADPEVLQKPFVEPTVVPVFVEPVPVHASAVEPVNISSPTEAVAPVSTQPPTEPVVMLQFSADELLAAPPLPTIEPVVEPTPAPAGPVAEPPPAQPLDTQVPLVESTDIPTLPVEVIAAPVHSEDSVVPVSLPAEPVVTPTCHLEPVAVSSPIETTDAVAEVISISVPPTDHSSVSAPPCETKDVPKISPEEVPTAPTHLPAEAVCTPSPVACPTPLPNAEEVEAIAMASPSTVNPPVPLLALEDHADVLPNSTAAAPLVGELLALPAAVDSTPSPPKKPVEIHHIPSLLDTMSPPPQLPPPKTPVVNENEVRTQIKSELQRLLEQEMSQAQLRIQKQLEEEKLKARALAQAAAQVQIQAQVKKVLDEEKAALQKSLKETIMKERMNTEDERLIAQYYWLERKAQKLEERDEDLRKQDALYREQINKLEEKSSQFYKVTNESFQKGKEDAHNRFKRFHIKPACYELQEQIMRCYKDNQGQTLACSSIASLYIQCVDKAKQKTKTSIGG